MLFTISYSASFSRLYEIISIQFSHFGCCIDFDLFQVIVKPVSLLLEDQRSEASSEGDNQRSTLLFIELVEQSLEPVNNNNNNNNVYSCPEIIQYTRKKNHKKEKSTVT